MSVPLNDRTTSPCLRPASAAGLPAVTAATSAPCCPCRPRLAAIAGVISWICTPSQPRLTLPCSWSCATTDLATFDGTAKPMPTLPPFGE